MQTIKETAMDAPADVAVCPICGAAIRIHIIGWEQQDDGTWAATSIETDCVSEPEFDDDSDASLDVWHSWFAEHYSTPYIDWLPVDRTIERWLLKNYRFDIAPQQAEEMSP